VAVAGLVVIAGGLLAGIDGMRTRSAVAAARSENRAVRALQEALREQAFDLAGRSYEAVERGRWMTRLTHTPGRSGKGESLGLPAKAAGDEALLAWLSEQSVRLDALGNAPAARR